MKDAIIVGGGLAGLSAAWRLRHWDTFVLESDARVGGRIKSERRGDYWLNWGGHVFAGEGSFTEALLKEVGVSAVTIPGSLQAISMNGKLLKTGTISSYPFRLPMSRAARAATIRTGMKLLPSVARYLKVVRARPGESAAMRQQRIYDFENDRTFQDFLGDLPEDAAALFGATATRSAGNVDEISAGAGIGYFSLVLGMGEGLNRGILGGPSTLTETLAAGLGEDLQLEAEVQEIIQYDDSVTVRYHQGGVDQEVQGRTVILATTADISQRIGVTLPEDLRDALGQIQYGPHVSSAFLTNEQTARPWDDVYAISAPKRSFGIALNQANIVRGMEAIRRPGGSMMTFSPAALGAALLDKDDDEVIQTHLADLDDMLGHGFADSVTEAKAARWRVASPYAFPGRAKLQSTLTRGAGRVCLAGDFMGSLYTESAIASAFAAAQNIASILATERQSRPARFTKPTDG